MFPRSCNYLILLASKFKRGSRPRGCRNRRRVAGIAAGLRESPQGCGNRRRAAGIRRRAAGISADAAGIAAEVQESLQSCTRETKGCSRSSHGARNRRRAAPGSTTSVPDRGAAPGVAGGVRRNEERRAAIAVRPRGIAAEAHGPPPRRGRSLARGHDRRRAVRARGDHGGRDGRGTPTRARELPTAAPAPAAAPPPRADRRPPRCPARGSCAPSRRTRCCPGCAGTPPPAPRLDRRTRAPGSRCRGSG